MPFSLLPTPQEPCSNSEVANTKSDSSIPQIDPSGEVREESAKRKEDNDREIYESPWNVMDICFVQ